MGKVSIDAGNYCFHYLVSYDIVYLCLVDSSYPAGLAFTYLQELNDEFYRKYGDSVYQFDSPWSCVAFANGIARLQSEYINPRTPKNLKRINAELGQVQDIMRQNLADIMDRGHSLESILDNSNKIKDTSRGFKKKAKWINVQAQMQQYAIPCVIILIVALVLIFRYWFSS